MGMLRIMGRAGDTRVAWPDIVTDAEGEAAVREAERIFAEERSRGTRAYEVKGGVGTEIKEFNKQAEKILLVPPMQGG